MTLVDRQTRVFVGVQYQSGTVQNSGSGRKIRWLKPEDNFFTIEVTSEQNAS